ncbi:DNA methyltransferase [Heyndrickxia sporothermodurans]
MEIVKISVNEINPATYNPRIDLQPGDSEYEKLKTSIEEFGYIDPLIWNKRTGNLVGGHQRYKILLDQGLKEIYVSVVDLDETKEKALNLALNKISGEWDNEKLHDLIEELQKEDISIEITGFEEQDLEQITADLDPKVTLTEKIKENPIDSNLFDSFLFPPFSYIDTKTQRWKTRKKQWKSLGIKSELGRDDNLTFSENLKAKGLEGTSIFDPVLCELVYRWFSPNEGAHILDPFSGGSVRGIVARVLNHKYTGIDLRSEQIEANRKNANEIGLSEINWIIDNSLNMSKYIEDNSVDLLFTCPPYFDLEVYSNNVDDISNMSYEDFAEVYSEILKKGARKLKHNRFAVVVISDVRNNKGFYRDLTGLTKQAFKDEGVLFYNDLILLNVVGSGALRARNQMKNRKVVRMHQNVLVFYKGEPREIKEHFPILETLENDLEGTLDSLDI